MSEFKFLRRGGYECSSKGDARFSAFNAMLPDGRSIEQHYQCDVKGYQPGGRNWRLGKGRPPLDPSKDLWKDYLNLWREWSRHHPELLAELRKAARKTDHTLSDMFAKTPVNQARALATILNETDNSQNLIQKVSLRMSSNQNSENRPSTDDSTSRKTNIMATKQTVSKLPKPTIKVRENDDDTRNVIIGNVELFWASLDPARPRRNPYGNEQWEIAIRFPTKYADLLEEFGKVKECEDEGYEDYSQIDFRKKSTKNDGSDAAPVKVWDGDGDIMDDEDIVKIGNGSKGAVKLYVRTYDVKHPKSKKVLRQGVASMLTGVKVEELVEYEGRRGGGGFDFDEDDADDTPPSKPKTKKRATEVDDDDDDDTPPPKSKKAAPASAKKSPRRVEVEDDDEDDEEDTPLPKKTRR
jgi:hypothetical protein